MLVYQRVCLEFLSTLCKTLKYISGKDILPTLDTSGCSSQRRLGYQTNARGLNIRSILQRNAATLLELKIFLNLANPKIVMSTQVQKPLNPPSLQIDDVAEDSARQRFANYMRLQKRNARGDQTKKKEVAYFGTWKFGRALRFLTLPVLFWFPLPFGLNLVTLQLCAWCMFLSYTNSWGAPIVGPGLLSTFMILSHHILKCADPTARVRGCVSMDL